MNAHLIKTICHELGRTYGHANIARLAGVCPSVWSDYCNFEKPDTTVPMHRALLIEEALGRRPFAKAMADLISDTDAGSEDARTLGALALEAIAKAELGMAQAFSDGSITENEKRELLAQAQRLVERAHDFAACISGMTTGATPAPRALKVAG